MATALSDAGNHWKAPVAPLLPRRCRAARATAVHVCRNRFLRPTKFVGRAFGASSGRAGKGARTNPGQPATAGLRACLKIERGPFEFSDRLSSDQTFRPWRAQIWQTTGIGRILILPPIAKRQVRGPALRGPLHGPETRRPIESPAIVRTLLRPGTGALGVSCPNAPTGTPGPLPGL